MRRSKIVIGAILLVGSIGLFTWLKRTIDWQGEGEVIKTEFPVRMDIINKRVISGALVPAKEVALKAEIAGILDKLYVSIGDKVQKGTAIARIKVLPKSSAIEAAKKRLYIAQIAQKEAEGRYQRCRQLFQQEMLSQERYEATMKEWEIACAEVDYARKDLDFILQGYIKGAQGASNVIKSTISGIVSELPYKEGASIMERSNLQEGDTVAMIADMNTILFQGQVSEMDVAHLHTGMQFAVSLLALEGKSLSTTLTKIAPKAIASRGDGSIKFAIEGVVQLAEEDKNSIRAGYTAIADVVLDKATNVLAIQEKYVHTEDVDMQVPSLSKKDPREDKSFVWVYANKKKLKRHVELGISDGLYVEIKKGLTAEDQVITTDDPY